MPVHPVRRGGKIVGYRYGTTGKLYRGASARARAIRQGRAIKASRKK